MKAITTKKELKKTLEANGQKVDESNPLDNYIMELVLKSTEFSKLTPQLLAKIYAAFRVELVTWLYTVSEAERANGNDDMKNSVHQTLLTAQNFQEQTQAVYYAALEQGKNVAGELRKFTIGVCKSLYGFTLPTWEKDLATM